MILRYPHKGLAQKEVPFFPLDHNARETSGFSREEVKQSIRKKGYPIEGDGRRWLNFYVLT
ncbi:MAG: hypothetical protein D6704_11620 [Nitrospirae bacterium]|nr:MAG: hypothetical protein D6704_11620 [Nitrospirota bacterium]